MEESGSTRTAQPNEKNANIVSFQATSDEEQDSKLVFERQNEAEEQGLSNMMQKRHPLLKYAYREDQWSPLNRSGKRIYDREFLIELRNDPKIYIKPLDLPAVATILPISRTRFKEVDQLRWPNPFGYLVPDIGSRTIQENQVLKNLIHIETVKHNETREPFQNDTPPKEPPLLKYTYEVDQWSPLNKNGKKVYDGEFLTKLQSDPNSKIKPNLPDLDIVLKEKSSPSAPKKNKRKNKKLAVMEDIKLRETENPWRAPRLKTGHVSEEDNSTAALHTRVRLVLNKLMPQKLNVLVGQVKALKIDSQEKLLSVVDLIFEKAVNEPRFTTAYALMCKELALIEVSGSENEAGEEDSDINFRKLIIIRCVIEFEKAVDQSIRAQKREIEAIADLGNELRETLTEQERISRTKSFGNIRFIGELFKQELLTTYIVDRCIRYLLSQINDESLECLSELLVIVGNDFESKNQKLEPYFEQISDIVNRKVPGKVSSRVRFMLQDVIELRKNKWIQRNSHSSTKMMDEIEIEAETKSSASTSSTPASTKLEEQLARRSASILEKYLYNADIYRTAPEVCETFDNSTLANFVSEALNTVIEKSATAREQVSQLMVHLISENILPLSLYLAGLADVLDMAEDLVIDIPKIWIYLAELIWYPLAVGVHPMSEFRTLMDESKNKGSVENLIKPLALISVREHQCLNWSNFFRGDEFVDNFIKKKPFTDDLQSSNESAGQNISVDVSNIVKSEELFTFEYMSNEIVGQNISADVSNIVKSEELSTFEYVSSEQDKPSTPLISEPTFIGSNDHADSIREPSCGSTSPVRKSRLLISKKNLAKKSALILENYLSDASIDTAAVKVRETFDDSTFSNFVRESLSKVVNKSTTDRKQVGQLMAHLISENILPLSLYLSSFGEVLDGTGNVVIDFTQIWVYLAELISYPLAAGVHSFSELKKMMASLKSKGLAGTLMGELMIVLVREKSPEWVKDEWDRSGLEWSDFLQENESLDDFTKKYKLEFLFGSKSNFAGSSGQLNMVQIQYQLLCVLCNENNSLANMCSWISTNVGERTSNPEFIKVLMTTILDICIEVYSTTWHFKVDKFQTLQHLITRYIDPDIKLSELQCLIAIQEYIHQLDHPQRVLLEILEKQIFESILSFDVFHVWESNKDLTPHTGKSAAMFAIKSFFTSLRETKAKSSRDKT